MADKTQTIKSKKVYREAAFILPPHGETTRGFIDEEARTVELAFSSEAPCSQWFGQEVLDHSPGAVRLERIKAAGAVLVGHDRSDLVAVPENIRIDDDRMGRASVRFGNSARANEIFQDVIDGIRRTVSVGYRIHEMKMIEERDDGPDTYLVTDWEPFEISFEPAPNDYTVGVGRDDGDHPQTINVKPLDKEIEAMGTETITADVDVDAIRVEERANALKGERERSAEILAMRKTHPQHAEICDQFLHSDRSAADCGLAILAAMETAGEVTKAPETGAIGLSKQETRDFNLMKALRYLVSPSQRNASAAGLELEASRTVADNMGKEPEGLYIPYDFTSRAINVGTDSAGGYTVNTEDAGMSMIEMLRNAMVVAQAGAKYYPGLVGDFAVSKQTGGATGYIVAEGVDVTESALTFGQATMTPYTFGAYSDITRKMLLQSSIAIENGLKMDLATTLATMIDLKAIHGSGSSEPTGVLATSGIGSVAGGTNGLAPAWSHVVDLESEVAVDNALIGTAGYITNHRIRGKLKKTPQHATAAVGPWVWENGSAPGVGEINGYPAYATNQVSSTLTKGSSTDCSAIAFGIWAEMIVGLWSSIDINVDMASLSKSGGIRVVALQDADVMIRHAESFAAMLDARHAG